MDNVNQLSLNSEQVVTKYKMSESYYNSNTTFTKRPVVPQLLSYLIFSLQICIYYGIILPNYVSLIKSITMTIIFSLSVVMLLWTTLSVSMSDPSDSVMIEYRNGHHEKYLMSIYRIEQMQKQTNVKLLYCEFCSSFVLQKSRHCKICDRCTGDFDHHCMWINNCIGGKNYRIFVSMIISAFLNMTVFVIALIILTTQAAYNNYLAQFILAWCVGAVVIVFMILIINLIGLHVYLGVLGISTYQFILLQRQQQKRDIKKQQQKTQQLELKSGGQQVNAKVHPAPSIDSESNSMNLALQDKIDTLNVIDNVIRVSSKCTSEWREGRPYNGKHSRQDSGQHKQKNGLYKQNGRVEQIDLGKAMADKSEIESEGVLSAAPEQGQSDTEEHIRISRLFTRNKSFRLLINTQSSQPKVRQFASQHYEKQQDTTLSPLKRPLKRPKLRP